MNDALISEVNEAVRKDQWRALWQRLGNRVIGVSIGIIVLTIVYVIWQNQQESKQERATQAIVTGVDAYSQERFGEAAEAFADARETGTKALGSLAQLWENYSIARADNPEDAAANNAEPFKGNVASDAVALNDLLALQHFAAATEDAPASEALLKRLQADDFTFAHSAQEMLAAYYLQRDEGDKARDIINAASLDPTRSAAQNTRIALLRSQLPSEAASADAHKAQ